MNKRRIVILLTVLFLWLVISRFTELEQLRSTLAGARYGWVLAALGVLILYYLAFSASYQAAFAAVGVPTRLREVVPLTLGVLFVNVVVPTGAAGGAALFADDFSRRGKPPAGAAAGVLLQLIADFSSFFLILIPGLAYLFVEHDLKVYEIIAALILALITVGMVLLLVIGVMRPSWLTRLLHWSQHMTNRMLLWLRRPAKMADDWAHRHSQEFTAAAAAIAQQPARLLQAVTLTFIAHLLDLAALFLLFRAFRQPIGVGALVAGYAMGILFWIVSITPQGIGVVEGMMTLTFTSLGVPAATAATVSLAFRGITFWLPMLLGFLAVQRLHAAGGERRLADLWTPRIAAALAALMGVVNLLSAITPGLADRLQLLKRIFPLVVQQGSHLASALAGFALMLTSSGLWRRKRAAWALTMAALAVSAASHLLKGLDYEEAVLALGLMALLWALRAAFQARSDPPSVRQALVVLPAALLFTLVYGILGLYLLDRHYRVNFSLGAAFIQTLRMFAEFSSTGLEPVTGFGRYFAASIYLVAATTVGYALVLFIRPVLARRTADPTEIERARQIVAAHGRSSLANFALLPDKLYFFTAGGSLINYAVKGRIALALGDPIGPEADLPAALAEFDAFCARNDWMAVYYQILPDRLAHYRAAGFELLCIGHEAIVDLNTFTLDGGAMKPLRWAVNHFTRLGYRACYTPPPQSPERLSRLRQVSDEWLETRHGSEKRFSLGWFDDAYIGGSGVMTVETKEGEIIAFTNLVSEYRRNEASIDLMRHRRDTPPGTMDFLFVELFRWARGQGYPTFNLGLSALSGIGTGENDPKIEKALHYIYLHVDRFYNFKGLHEFKEKFHPEWSPRYLAYRGLANLPAAALALARADSGDDLADYLKK